MVFTILFLGPTEREILAHIEEIVDHGLPIHKMKSAYRDLNSAKNMILNRITFCHKQVDVRRDNGSLM